MDGITPRFVLAAALPQLREFGLPIHPIGDGSVGSNDGWPEFLDESFALLAESVSVWRVGSIAPGILRLLRDTPPRPMSYVVRPGDALGLLAEDWGVDLRELMTANRIADPNHIWIGQRIVVPFAAGRGAYIASRRSRGGVHTIAPGDTLSDLAEGWGVTVEEVARLNGIADPNRVRIGQELIIPANAGATAAPELPISHTIAPGDNLWDLAARWGTSVEEIANLNGIRDPGHIWPGQAITVPRPGARPAAPLADTPPAAVSGGRYTVEPGDNLWSLARRWDTTVGEIMRLNGIARAGSIRIGTTLIVP